MSRLLFKEIPQEAKEYVRTNKAERVMLAVMATVFLLLGGVCLCLSRYLASVFSFVSLIIFVFRLLHSQ